MPPGLTLGLGMALLLGGAELLLRGAVRLASLWGLSALVIGLTVVAFGTSAPELAVSVAASVGDSPELAVANVVGSNIFNVLAILGLAALLRPLAVQREVVRREVPLGIGAAAALWLACRGGVGRAEALALLVALLVYVAWSIRAGRAARGPGPDLSEIPGLGAPEPGDVAGGHGGRSDPGPTGLLGPAALVVGGLAALVLGSRWLVEGASAVARALGVGETVIGLTVVAAGTSLPELATSAVAAARGERDIAVGNVLGSNLFNVLGIVGVAGALAPTGLAVPDRLLAFDLPVMIAAAVACLPVALTGHRVDRLEGAVLVVFYLGYLAVLAAASAGRLVLDGRLALLGFVVPLTLLAAAAGARRPERTRSG